MKNYVSLQQKYLIGTYPNRGKTFVRGEGVYLINEKGDRYLDLMSNYGTTIFGYRDPRITRSLSGQMEELPSLHGSFTNDTRALTAQALVKRCGGGAAQVFFSNSGAEAVEAALKFAVLATDRKKFICCRNGYHGKTLGALSATDNQKFTAAFQPLLWEFRFANFNDLAELDKILDDETAAFIVEPIQGEGGVQVPDAGYLKGAAKLCANHGVLFILDEIQTGVGRTGYFLASESEDLAFDILCLGKGLAGGFPVGATLVSSEVGSKIPRGAHTSTFGGNPVACAGILETLKILDEAMMAEIRSVGEYFFHELKRINSPLILGLKGRGLMIGLKVGYSRDSLLKALQREKILAIPAGKDVIRFLPPYIIEKKHVDHTVSVLKNILEDLALQVRPDGLIGPLSMRRSLK